MAKNKKKQGGAAQAKPLSEKRFLREKVRELPIEACYVNVDWQAGGLAHVIVTRRRKDGNLCIGNYLCDTWCLGVKDAFGAVNVTDDWLEKYIKRNDHLEFIPLDYNLAHNIVYGSEAFAAEAAVEAAPEFDLWQYVLEEDTEEVPLVDLEFGVNGKHHLVVIEGTRGSKYLPVLKERLGENFTYVTDFYEADDEDNEDDEDDEDFYSSEEPYQYNAPDYPRALDVKHQFIADGLIGNKEWRSLPNEFIEAVLALPKDVAVADLSNIILFAIGDSRRNPKKYRNIATIPHAIALLAQIGDPAGLDAVMEVLRQDEDFCEMHLSDLLPEIYPSIIYRLGKDRTDLLVEFIYHPGFYIWSKDAVIRALAAIAHEHPERRGEILELFSRYIDFMLERIPTLEGASPMVAASVVSVLIDLGAVDLLPKIKELHDRRLVDIGMNGPYDDVVEWMVKDSWKDHRDDFVDIYSYYKELQTWGN